MQRLNESCWIFVFLNDFLPETWCVFLLACLCSLLTPHLAHYFTFQCWYWLEKAWCHCFIWPAFPLSKLFFFIIPDRRRMWNSSIVSLKTALVWEGGDVISEGIDAWRILEPALNLPGIQPPPLVIQLVAQTLSLIKPAHISVDRKGHSDVIESQGRFHDWNHITGAI